MTSTPARPDAHSAIPTETLQQLPLTSDVTSLQMLEGDGVVLADDSKEDTEARLQEPELASETLSQGPAVEPRSQEKSAAKLVVEARNPNVVYFDGAQQAPTGESDARTHVQDPTEVESTEVETPAQKPAESAMEQVAPTITMLTELCKEEAASDEALAAAKELENPLQSFPNSQNNEKTKMANDICKYEWP